MKEWLPVRCCCTPTKIFGFVQLKPGAKSVKDKRGKRHRIKVRTYSECTPGVSLTKLLDNPALLRQAEWDQERAVYSDDRPAAFWRTIEGFVEVAT